MIGFALVFVLAVITLSAVAALAVALADPWLRARGPRAERRAVELAASIPVAVAVVLVTALLVRSYAGDDHCGVHDHHAHLCIRHGGAWAQRTWAVLVVAAGAAVVAARLALLLGRHLHGARSVDVLRRVGVRTGDVRLVESPRAFCFVAGVWRPQIYASSAAWTGLADDERTAMLTHERGHVRHHDLRWRLALELMLIVAAPLVAARLVRRWCQATERLRDREAVAVVGDPEPVARALVRMCRLQRGALAPGLSFTGPATELSRRVDAVLAGEPGGRRTAAMMARGLLALIVLVGGVVVGRIELVHHSLESLLG